MKKLTKTMVDALQPGATDQWLWDSEVPGFGVRCKPSGRKTYVVRYRSKAGVQRKMVLARTCDMPPDKARELARKIFAQVAEGQDPAAERRQEPTATLPTVEALFGAYVAHMRANGRASATEVERVLLKAKNNAADALGRTKQAAEITAADVVAYVAKIFKAGHRGAADKHRSYIASAYTWATKSANDYTVEHRQDWGVTINPAGDVPRDAQATKTRDRNLAAPELHALWRDTAAGAPGFDIETAACVRMLIACGQRVQETLRIEGSEIDLQQKLWRMPAHKTKGRKRPHVVPIPDVVLPDLQRLIDLHGDGLLFPGRDGEVMDHHSVGQALRRWYERTGTAPFQTRDLRRTWKSRAHDAGVDRFVRDLIQQHAKQDTGSKVYDHAEYLPQKREAMTKWSRWLERVIADPAPVIELAA